MLVCVTGRNGFIGSALVGELNRRNIDVSPRPTPKTQIVFHFGSPSSTNIFVDSPDYAIRETVESFLSLAAYCREHGLYLVYPSSATVYHKTTPYARTKAALEELQAAYNIQSLGLRIAAGYGPNEGHKGDYASVIYRWCHGMKRGERPVIYGDGTQTRDFIYIDDLVNAIVDAVTAEKRGIADIGTGINTSLNDVVKEINSQLGTRLQPVYSPAPYGYVQETPMQTPVPYHTDVARGIYKILSSN